jgi:hypothetical protein
MPPLRHFESIASALNFREITHLDTGWHSHSSNDNIGFVNVALGVSAVSLRIKKLFLIAGVSANLTHLASGPTTALADWKHIRHPYLFPSSAWGRLVRFFLRKMQLTN